MIRWKDPWQVLPSSASMGIFKAMTTMNISLPDDMKAFVDEQVRARGYMTASEYMRDVLQRERDVEQFRSMLETTVPTPIEDFNDAFFVRMRAKIDAAQDK